MTTESENDTKVCGRCGTVFTHGDLPIIWSLNPGGETVPLCLDCAKWVNDLKAKHGLLPESLEGTGYFVKREGP